MDQKGRLYRQGVYLRDRLAECRGRVRVRRLVEPEMRVADLHKGKLFIDQCGSGGAADRPERARYAAAYRPENAGTGPGHAFQQTAAAHARDYARDCGRFVIEMIAHALAPASDVSGLT